MYVHFTPSDIFRFWSKVNKNGPNGCWVWTPPVYGHGYGQFRHTQSYGKHVNIPAHRAAWIILRGQLEEGECVLHNCPAGDNPACVNPDHMFIGTRADNARDMYQKKRNVQVRGEHHGQSRLAEDDVRAIRSRYAAGGVSMRNLGTQYNVDASTIHDVVHRLRWGHVQDLA